MHRQLKKFKSTGLFMDKKKSGRPKKITAEIEQQIVAWVEEDRRRLASLLLTMVHEKFDRLEVNDRTIRFTMRKHGYFGGFVMQQDNDPKHTSKLCKNYLKSKADEGVLRFSNGLRKAQT